MPFQEKKSGANVRLGAESRPNSRLVIAKIVLIIYTVFGVLVFTIPQGLSNWAKGLRPGPMQEAFVSTAENIEHLSNMIGVSKPYKLARSLFLKVTGKDKD